MQRPLIEVAAGTGRTVSSSDAEGELVSSAASSGAKGKKSRFGGVRRIGKAKKESSGDSYLYYFSGRVADLESNSVIRVQKVI